MGPQCEDGYTAIANELLEALCKIRIPGESTQVFLTILRKTYGYKKVVDQISLSQFVAATGMKKPNICRALKQLQTLNVIKIDKLVSQNDNTYRVMYRINKHYDSWISEKRVQSRPETLSKRIINVIQNDNAPLSKTIISVIQNDTHKRKKETTTNEKKEPGDEKFFLPTPEQVQAYMDEIGFESDGEHFVDYYSAKGWMVGKSKMKDWKAAVRTWRKNSTSKKETHLQERPDYMRGVQI